MYLTEGKRRARPKRGNMIQNVYEKLGGETNMCADLGAASLSTRWIPIGFENDQSGVAKVITI